MTETRLGSDGIIFGLYEIFRGIQDSAPSFFIKAEPVGAKNYYRYRGSRD